MLAFTGKRGAEFDMIRAELFSISRGELYDGIVSLAAPAFGPNDKLEGAISISGPDSRFDAEAIARNRQYLYRASQRLTELFGGDGTRFQAVLP
ncbi:IclR family transcriptional regulator domain-containing protein [Cupriavidus necator]